MELNNAPPVNSGINYAGWNRNTNGITQSTIIHHPRGDVMKITRDDQPPVFNAFLNANCWQLVVDQGTTEGGSSGSPYFDQDHRIIGQHYGINDGNLPVCQQVNKFGGRFDLSWTGGGTNATRLSNWLDPTNTGSMTTNTTNIANLLNYEIVGNDLVCSTSGSYFINNLPTGATVTWSASPTGIVSLSSNGNFVTLTKIINGTIVLTAAINYNGCISQASKSVTVGGNGWQQYIYGPTSVSCGQMLSYQVANNSNFSYNWSFPSDWQYVQGIGSPVLYVQAGASSGNVDVTVFDGCDYFYSSLYVDINCGYYYSMSPNPASSTVTVSAKETTVKGEKVDKSITEIHIYDKVGILKKNLTLGKVKKATIDISNLKPDIYILEIVDGNFRERQQLSVVR